MPLPNETRLPLQYNWQMANKKIEPTETYDFDLSTGTTVTVQALRGVITFSNLDSLGPDPEPGCASAVTITLYNPRLNFDNPEKVYLNLTPYYVLSGDDSFVPHTVVATINGDGADILLYNVSPVAAGANQGEGTLKFYYEFFSF